jgi:PAS domain S-box-containing protein
VQARIYLALLQTGPAPIKEVAYLSKVARPDIYREILELQKSGIVEKIVDVPAKFKALPIIDAVGALMLQRTKESIELNKRANNLIESFKDITHKKTLSEDNQFILIPGQAIELESKKLLENSKYRLSIMISKNNLLAWLDKDYEIFQKALKRSVTIRIITEEFHGLNELKVIQDLKKFPNFEQRFAVGKLTVWLRIFNDTKILLTTSTSSGQTDFAAVFSNNPHLAELAQNYFDAAWFSAIEPQDQAFKRDRRQFDYLFANLTNGFSYNKLILDQNGKPIDVVILAANKAFMEISGLKKNIIGEKVSKVLPDMSKNLTSLIDKYWSIISTGKSANFEYWSQELEKWFSVVVYSPEKGYFVALAEDISQRKKTEKNLQESEEKFRKAFTIGPDAMVISRLRDSLIVDCNDAFLEAFGYSKDEVVGKLAMDLGVWANISDRERVTSRLKSEGKVSNEELLYKRKNGEIFPALISASLMQLNNEQYVMVTARDTLIERKLEIALKKSEQNYRLLFSSIDEGFCVIERTIAEVGGSIDFTFLEVNPAFLTQTGIDNVVGKTIRQVVPKESEDWIKIYDAILRTGKSKRFKNFLFTTGHMLDLFAFKVEDGTDNHVAVIFKDVTEREKDATKK